LLHKYEYKRYTQYQTLPQKVVKVINDKKKNSITFPSVLTALTGELLRPAWLDGLNAETLMVGIAACKVAIGEKLLDDVVASVVEFLIVAHI